MSNPVLVVDDDPDFVELVQALLRNVFDVEGCTDSKVALERIREINPILVVLDLYMPRPTGWDLLRALRNDSDFVDLPVLVISAAGSDVEETSAHVTGQMTGPVEILSKPFEIEDLLLKVRALVRWRVPSEVADQLITGADSRVGLAS